MDERIKKEGRETLTRDWAAFDFSTTDSSKGLPVPEIEKSFDDKNATFVELVSPDELKTGNNPLKNLFKTRQSRRKFGKTMSLNDLSYLLWAASGVKKAFPEKGISFRNAPSAGGRHAIDTYVYAGCVEGVPEGLYRYSALSHRLMLLDAEPDIKARVAAASHNHLFGDGVTFIWAAVPYLMEYKYDMMSHKFLAQDSGHLCQNVYLACEDIGCGCCAVGAYNQKLADELLGLDGYNEFTVYMASAGRMQE